MPLLKVKTVSGKVVDYEFSETSIKVNELSNRIATDNSFDNPLVELQRLICNGKVLKQDDVLEIVENTVVILMITKTVNKSNTLEKVEQKLETVQTNVVVNDTTSVNASVNTSANASANASVNASANASANVIEAPNPFTTPSEPELDELGLAQLAVTQHMIIKANPTLSQIISPDENLMEIIVKAASVAGLLQSGFEELSNNQQAMLALLIHFLKNNDAGKELFHTLKPVGIRLVNRMREDGVTGLVIDKNNTDRLQNNILDFESMTSGQLNEVKASILEGQPELFDELAAMSDEDFRKMMIVQSRAKRIKQQLDKLEAEDREAFEHALQLKIAEKMTGNMVRPSNTETLTPEDNVKIAELANNFGFTVEEVKTIYLLTGKNIEATADRLFS